MNVVIVFIHIHSYTFHLSTCCLIKPNQVKTINEYMIKIGLQIKQAARFFYILTSSRHPKRGRACLLQLRLWSWSDFHLFRLEGSQFRTLIQLLWRLLPIWLE